jgi:hypothetical protein
MRIGGDLSALLSPGKLGVAGSPPARSEEKDGKFEATLRTPFQNLRLSNCASHSKQVGKHQIVP